MREMATIEKGIPIPMSRSRSRVYPFGEMEVGDSFLIKYGDKDVRTMYSSASYYGKRNSKKFTIRQTPEGIRVWRTK